MKFSERWLRELVNPPVDTQTLCDGLTMAGLEVSSLTPVAGIFSKVVVGKVLAANQHPNADRLRVCTVEVGEPEPLRIVCGASNARAGIWVAVARVGAKLPGGLEIQKTALRGVDSMGMLCSAKELGLSGEASGILELS